MMIEKAILDYLNDRLSVEVFMERPDPAPARYVLIEKTGSGRYNLINNSTLAIQSYAERMIDAATLNEEVKAAMYEAAALNEIGRVSLNSDYNYTDISLKQYRYQAVFDITHY